MRERKTTDFCVDVEGVGRFTFARRTLRDDLAVATEYSRLIEGIDTPTEWLSILAGCVAALKVLTVTEPEGWNLLDVDPLDEDGYASILRVHNALRSAEARFRETRKESGARSGQEHGGNGAVLVSEEIQPSAK